MEKVISVSDTGALGDGISDDSAAFQRALDKAQGGKVVIPAGKYRICRTLRVHSNTIIEADKCARVFLCDKTPKKQGDFLLTNDADSLESDGNYNIKIHGGIWDGAFGGLNDKPKDIFAPDGWSGALLNFVGVNGLYLSDMVVANSVTYFIRMSKIDGFRIENLTFTAEKKAYNQDGLHFGGEVRNGTVRGIRALRGQTNDDLLALNADDSLVRIENRGLVRGTIENIIFEDIYAEDCFTAVRMLSVTSPIRHIKIRNLFAGCRHYLMNMDAARYCRTPLFTDAEHPEGVGQIEDVLFDGVTAFFSGNDLGYAEKALICLESRADGFEVRNFNRLRGINAEDTIPTLHVENITDTDVVPSLRGTQKAYTIKTKEDRAVIDEDFVTLTVTKRK